MKIISLVLPIYNERQNIPKLWEEITTVTKKTKTGYKYEFIFINDGSSDGSEYELEKLYKNNQSKFDIKIINFSRNYGHQIAVTAGQEYANGEIVVIMDTDLQDPPSVILDMLEKYEEGDHDIVYAQRRRYKTNFFKEKSAWIFYRLMKKVANVDIPVDTGDFRLISKRVNDEMKKYNEKAKFLRGISCLTGFKQTGVMFDRSDRYKGKPSYTFSKSLKLAVDGITGFSVTPLKFISIIGFGVSIFSFLFGILYIPITIILNINWSGWVSIMSGIVFLGGLQILMLGIIGEYIGRIYTETLNRPLYTIDKKIGFSKTTKLK